MQPPEIGVIADDLTGAMDTGVQFVAAGHRTRVMLDDADLPSGCVVVLSTDSRDLPAREARARARDASRRLRGRAVYKKVDSALRGNLGAEIDGTLEGLGLDRVLFAPAFPDTGRTTAGGIHLVRGVPLSEGSFASDPLWPATESGVASILARQLARPIRVLPVEVTGRGTADVASFLSEAGPGVVAADASTNDHLATLATALVSAEPAWLPCGSGGLAGAWCRALGSFSGPAEDRSWHEDARPVLVVAGSRHPASVAQLKRAAGEGLEIVQGSAFDERDVDRAASSLGGGRSLALSSVLSPYEEGLADLVARALARAAATLLEKREVAGLFLTGGDIARAVARELGATALEIHGEVQPGVVAGTLAGGPHAGLRVVTKAGGFGAEDAILDSIDYLRGGRK